MAKITNENFQTIINESSDAIIILNGANETIFANKRSLELFKTEHYSEINIDKYIQNPANKEIILDNNFKAYILDQKSSQIALNTFAEVSHDIKNPLHSINGFTSALLEGIGGDLTDTQKKYVSIISKNTSNLSLMMYNIIDISKYESGVIKTNNGDISYKNLVCSLRTKLLDYKFQNKVSIEEINYDSDSDIFISDNAFLTQLLLNLIFVISNNYDNPELYIKTEIQINKPDEYRIYLIFEDKYCKDSFNNKFNYEMIDLKGSTKLAIHACNTYYKLLNLELEIERSNNKFILSLIKKL